jgi:hypothetical protein
MGGHPYDPWAIRYSARIRAAIWFHMTDSPPLKWSDLRYVFDIKEDCNGKEAIQA